MFRTLTLALLVLSSQAAAQSQHPCARDALARAEPLLRVHWGSNDMPRPDIDSAVASIPPIRALQGSGKIDVLEVWGHIYRTSYRMRFLYARIPGTCALMGQEILENSDPY